MYNEYQVVQDIEKIEKALFRCTLSLVNLGPVSLTDFPTWIKHDV